MNLFWRANSVILVNRKRKEIWFCLLFEDNKWLGYFDDWPYWFLLYLPCIIWLVLLVMITYEFITTMFGHYIFFIYFHVFRSIYSMIFFKHHFFKDLESNLALKSLVWTSILILMRFSCFDYPINIMFYEPILLWK